MPNPAWFNETYYAEQKVAQMNATSYEMGDGGWLATNGGGATQWTVALYNQYLAQYTLPGTQQSVTTYQNFEACNGADYAASITLADVNVSPNQYFNVNEYLQALADYNNANPDAYEGSAPAGGWTVASELDTIFNTYHSSVWNHYDANWDTLQINPSNAFDTMAYLEARAEAMGNGAEVKDAIAAIKEAGLNPVQDFFSFGAEHNISATPAATPVTPVLPDSSWTVWGDSATPPSPEEVDPFEQDVTHVAMTAGQTTYPGEGETYSGNTQFDATWVPSSADSSLSAKDVITGPEDTYNTLSVTLGKNWTGFSGVKQDDGTVAPSVTNIGRVELIHNPANNEASWTFDATNISDDAYRFDLVGANGPGAISLSNLSDAVSEIHISDLTPADTGSSKVPSATTIGFATGANKGKADELTLVVENVGAEGKAAPIKSGTTFGIETLTINTAKGDGASYLDLSQVAGVKTLNFSGAGDITVTNVATGIKTYDASEATGDVNMTIVSPSSSTVVKGGAGNDTVNVSGTWTPAGLENIENLALSPDANINLKNVDSSLTDIWLFGNGTVRNLTADSIIAHQQASASGTVQIDGTSDGTLGNLTYVTLGAEKTSTILSGTLSSNATGDVTIGVNGKDQFNNAAVTLKNASTLAVDVAENATFNVSTLTADNVTQMTLNASSGATVTAGSMKALQELTLNLANSSTDASNPDTTKFLIDLQSAQQVTVNAEGQSVELGDLGDSSKGDSSVTLNVSDAYNFTVGSIGATLGCNIDVNIEAEKDVVLGSLKNSTNLLAGGEGDIQVVVAGATVDGAGTVSFEGGPMSIDFGNVEGTAFATKALTLNSTGTISYTGAEGDDQVTVTGLSAGTSTFDMGGGSDTLTFRGLKIGDGNTANVNITIEDINGLSVDLTDSTGTVVFTVDGVVWDPATPASLVALTDTDTGNSSDGEEPGDQTGTTPAGPDDDSGTQNPGDGDTDDGDETPSEPGADDDDTENPGTPEDPENPDDSSTGTGNIDFSAAPIAAGDQATVQSALANAGISFSSDLLDTLFEEGTVYTDGTGYGVMVNGSAVAILVVQDVSETDFDSLFTGA